VRGLLAAVDEEGPAALLGRLEAEMLDAARKLEFERAASLRDRIEEVRMALASAERMGLSTTAAGAAAAPGARRATAMRGGPPRGRRRPGRSR
jgi:excinuclease UvrABC nuclease subunit